MFSEDKRFVTIEDYNFWIKLSLKKIKFKEIKKCLGFYNVGDANIHILSKIIIKFFIFLKYKKFLKNIEDFYYSKNLFRYIAKPIKTKNKYKKKVFLYLIKSEYIKISKIKILIKLIINFFLIK